MSEYFSSGSCSKHGPGHTDAECPDKKQQDTGPVREKNETRYFIREATLEKTLERLKEVEPSKRKIIVYAGVHPNEGTDMLSAKYAATWAEKYGATVVCQPTEETPHALWQRHKQATDGDASIPLPPDVVLDEEGNADQFCLDDPNTFIIRFHGTPLSYARNRQKPGLKIVTSRFAAHPEEFKERPRAAIFSKPHIAEGLGAIMDELSSDAIRHEVVEEAEQEDSRFLENKPNALLVEYYYKDKPVEIDDPYIRELQKRESEVKDGEVFPLSPENWQRQLKNGLEYVDQPTLTDEAVADFDGAIVGDFEKMIEHISRQLTN